MLNSSSNWLFILSLSAAALGLSLAGCTESSSNNGGGSEEKPCEDSAYQCSGSELQKCTDGNWKTDKTCDSEALCNASKKRCDECEANSISCAEDDGKAVLTWCEAGKKLTKECADGCDGNACKNEEPPQIACENDDYQCSDNKLEKCTDGNWDTQETCESKALCNAAKKRCDECEASSISCAEEDGKAVLTWCEAGQKQTKECENGCDGNACKDEQPPTITCENGDFRCTDAVLEKCTDGNWEPQETCESADKCFAEAGICGSCSAEQHSCELVDKKSIYSWCDNGEMKSKECANGCDGDVCKKVCEEDEWKCSSTKLQKCVDNAWVQQDKCAIQEFCKADLKRCNVCNDGAWMCGMTTLKKCVDGLWVDQQTCDTAALCESSLQSCAACVEGAWQCSDKKLETCIQGKWETKQTCDAADLCNAPQNRCDECKTGTKSCTDSTYTWCENGIKKELTCTGGCDKDECKSDLCPDNPDKTAPGVCGCSFEDKDIDGDGKIDCPVRTFPDDALPELPDIEGKCAEWNYPKHPVIEYPKLPEFSYETTIDIDKYGISNVYDVTKAEATTKGLNKAISDAKAAGFTRIVIPDGHYPILVDFNHSDTSALNPPNDVAIIMSKNVIPQQFPSTGYDCNIINLRKKANIYVEGGQLIGERYDHTLSKPTSTDEECNAITSYYSNHIFLNGLKIKSSHGDGILLFDKKGATDTPSSNFIIANCEIDDVFRNGIAVVGIDGVRITNNEIHHTNGTAPQFAIDFEATKNTPEDTNAIVDHNYFHDNVAGDLIIDAYDTFIEYNRFSQGDMKRYIDNPFIVRNHSSYIAYRNNFEKFTKSTGCGYTVCCSYATNYDPEVEQKYPSFFVENEITHTRLMLTRRNKVCVKQNTIHEGHMSASTIHQLRLIDNRVEHYTKDAVSGYYSFQKVFGTASGNVKCTAEDKCEEVTSLNAMAENTEFNIGGNYF